MDNKVMKWLLYCNELQKMGYTGLPVVLEYSKAKREFHFNVQGVESPKGFKAIGFAPSSLVSQFAEVMMRVMMRTKYTYPTHTMEDFFDTMIYLPLRMKAQ